VWNVDLKQCTEWFKKLSKPDLNCAIIINFNLFKSNINVIKEQMK